MQELREIQTWYLTQCDGEWEHGCGVSISTLDNPGWRVVIDLSGTALEGKEFVETNFGLENAPEPKFLPDGRLDVDDPSLAAFEVFNADQNWLTCSVKSNRFEGHGGPEKLQEILAIFLRWANSGGARN